MSGQWSRRGRGGFMHDFLGFMQPRIPHSLHKQMDESKEKHLPTLPKGLDHSKNSEIMSYEGKINLDVLNCIWKNHWDKVKTYQKYQKESSGTIINSGEVGLVAPHFLDAFLEAHGLALIVGLGSGLLDLSFGFLSISSWVSLKFGMGTEFLGWALWLMRVYWFGASFLVVWLEFWASLDWVWILVSIIHHHFKFCLVYFLFSFFNFFKLFSHDLSGCISFLI